MDSTQIQQFNDGLMFGISSTLPLFGSLLVISISVFLIRKFLRF